MYKAMGKDKAEAVLNLIYLPYFKTTTDMVDSYFNDDDQDVAFDKEPYIYHVVSQYLVYDPNENEEHAATLLNDHNFNVPLANRDRRFLNEELFMRHYELGHGEPLTLPGKGFSENVKGEGEGKDNEDVEDKTGEAANDKGGRAAKDEDEKAAED